MADALATLADNQPTHHRRHHAFGVPIGLTRAKVAREKKPTAPRAHRAAPIEAPAIVRLCSRMKGRVLASISDYRGLWAAIRAQVDAMRITRLELDHSSGLEEGYSSTLLASAQVKSVWFVRLNTRCDRLAGRRLSRIPRRWLIDCARQEAAPTASPVASGDVIDLDRTAPTTGERTLD